MSDIVGLMRAQEAYRLQLRCFLGLVQEQRHLPSLKQLLKLYTAISLPKLASLMDLDEPTLRSQLILLKVPPFHYNPFTANSHPFKCTLAICAQLQARDPCTLAVSDLMVC